MNYIAEIKAFYDWLEINPLPSPAIVLWYALMHIANKTGWQQEFTVAVSVLQNKTGLNAKAIERARNSLTQSGRIEWRSRKGSQSAIYEIIPLCDISSCNFVAQNVAQSVAEPVAQTVLEPVAQSVAINKHKLNNNKKDTNVSKKERPPKKKMGEYGHVTLTDEEIHKLTIDYGDLVPEAIRFLDEYVEMKGYKHKSSYLAIRKWVIDAVKEKNKPAPQSKSKNQFNNFNQRDTDYNSLVMERLKKQFGKETENE